MPFGVKTRLDSGTSVDFDAIYEDTVRPALRNVGIDPVRMDQDIAGLNEDIVPQRLIGAEFFVADITTRDPAILFLLGARAERMPGTTLVLAGRGSQAQLTRLSSIPLISYDLDQGNRLSSRESTRLRHAISSALTEMLGSRTQAESTRPRLTPHEQERSTRGVAFAQEIEAAHESSDVGDLQRLEAELRADAPDSPLLLNLFQSYGNLGAWEPLVNLFHALPEEMRKLPRVRQQAALALNRLGKADDAVSILYDLLKELGPDSETLSLLGSIYKDKWFESLDSETLNLAIDSYVRGFEANRKDPYSGINAVTLLEIRGDASSRATKDSLLPLVEAAVQDQMKYSKRRNYWDYATLLELAVLSGDEKLARQYLIAARACYPEGWQTEATAEKLAVIHTARHLRGEQQPWLDQILAELYTSVPA
jgi:hypothetical protein